MIPAIKPVRFKRIRSLVLRGAGYGVIALGLIVGIFFASQRSLAALDKQDRRARSGSITAPAPGGNNLIEITVHTVTIDHALPRTPIEMRVGVAYDNRIAYWRDAIPLMGTNGTESINTVVASRESGEVIVVVGPLPSDPEDTQPSLSDSIHGSIVWIDARPYTIVHRKSVENLIEMKSRQGEPVQFSESAVGVQGEIELRHVS